jgi:hypothetical protein
VNCENCGASLSDGAKFCKSCGQPAPLSASAGPRPRFVAPSPGLRGPPPGPEAVPRPEPTTQLAPVRLSPLPASPVAGPPRGLDPPSAVMARIVGVFAAIGLGLAVGGVLVLWVAGFFGAAAQPSGGFNLFTAGLIAGIIFTACLGFGLLVSIVVAAVGGVYASGRTADLPTAARVGALGAAGGYLALVLVLGSILFGVIAIGVGFGGADEDPLAQQRAECERVLGAGSPSCQSITAPPAPEGGVDLTNVAKLTLGVIPAALTGGVAAAVSFSRASGHT